MGRLMLSPKTKIGAKHWPTIGSVLPNCKESKVLYPKSRVVGTSKYILTFNIPIFGTYQQLENAQKGPTL